jgi:hypothetical protein
MTVTHVIVDSASLPFVNAPEARLLTGREPTDPAVVEPYAAGIIAALLPGASSRPGPTDNPDQTGTPDRA